jgi:glycosyltransferase involved in cell wall biosynthesis
MTVGFYSPLPPARTGVADYAAALLAELRRRGRVQVAPRRCDVALYHLGNNPLHAAIYRRALEHPGVVALHDAVLHHFLLGQLDEAAYVEEFVYNYGEWERGLARELWRGRAASGADPRYFQYSMLKRVAERALAVVAHNAAAARAVRAAAPDARVVEIPHLLETPPAASQSETLRYRQRVGVDPGAFLFGVFGYLRESKRLFSVLEVFAEVHREIPATALLVAGQFVSSHLESAVAPLLAQPGVVRRPHLTPREFWMAASAVDACINLRHPSAGETSGIAIRMMGLGKPVLLTDGEECAGFPEGACVRIPPGPTERESLRQHMILLPSMFDAARAIGQRGAGHVAAHHRVDQVGQHYWDLLCALCT